VAAGLASLQLPSSAADARWLLREADTDSDGRVTLPEFEAFCDSQLSRLRRVYDSIDSNHDGRLTSEELRLGCLRAGLKISNRQLRTVFHHLDENSDGSVSFAEFCSALVLLPAHNAAAVLESFGHYYAIEDAEGEYTVAREPPPGRSLATALFNGVIAGAVSRTATAPIDRVKTMLQAGPLQPLEAVAPAAAARAQTARSAAAATAAAASPHISESAHACADAKAATGHQPRPGAASVAAHTHAHTASPAALPSVALPVNSSCTPTAAAFGHRLGVMSVEQRPGVASVAARIWADGGAAGFFRGNGANVLKIGPETAAKFVAFDALKRVVAQDPGNVTVGERFVAGGAAGAFAQALVYPLETVKTRLSLAPAGKYRSLAACARDVAGSGGSVVALYRGLAPSLAGIVPYAGIDLMVNSVFKDAAAARYDAVDAEPGVAALLGCGMASSSVAMLATYPLNLVRTRMQACGMPGAPSYDGAFGCVSAIVRSEGVSGLYRGLLPNFAKVLPASSISYTVYDMLNRGWA